MIEPQMTLFTRALSKCKLKEKDNDVLTAVAMTLSGHPDVFRACYIAFMNDEPSYHYHPMIGAPLEFFYEKELVRIRRLQEEVILPRSVFIQYASYVDLCLSRIYPLGSVVELDRELLPKDLVESFESEQMDFFVVISGRRVDLANGHYVDYIGHGYPFGLRFDISPLLISNLFIKRVVSEGYSDTVDEHYCQEALRKDYLDAGLISSVYAEEEVNED